MLDTDLAIAGLGLGLVIAPLTSATLRVVPVRPARHRIGGRGGGPDDRHAGRHRGAERLGPLPVQPDPAVAAQPPANSLAEKLTGEATKYKTAFAMQYGEMFGITAIVCVVGAMLALFISGRNEHADEPEAIAPEVDEDETPAQMIEPPSGRHRSG